MWWLFLQYVKKNIFVSVFLEIIITLATVLQENDKAIFLERFLFLLLFSKRHGTVLAYFNEINR